MRSSVVFGLVLALTGCSVCKEEPEVERVHGVTQDVVPVEEYAARTIPVPQDLSAPKERAREFRRGVSLGLFAQNLSREEELRLYRHFLDEMVEIGVTDVMLVVQWAQDEVTSSSLYASDRHTVQDDVLVSVIQAARSRSLRVFLMPIVYLKTRYKGVWRGALKPDHEDDWWKEYEYFVLYYANIAQAQKVDLFAVGSELLSMERKTARWLRLIQRVRDVYKGSLTYSANWDHFEPIAFWDALDVVGMTAYQELSSKRSPTREELRRGWRPFQQRLRDWARRVDKPYIFTEVGYPAHAQGAMRPWDHRPRDRRDWELQARCYEALFEEWHEDPRLQGLYVWNWFGSRSATDRGYSPRGKPSEGVLRYWYTESLPKEP